MVIFFLLKNDVEADFLVQLTGDVLLQTVNIDDHCNELAAGVQSYSIGVRGKGEIIVFRAGAAEVDITPPIGLPMDGYMARSGVSVAIHDPLMAQILLLDDGRQRVGLLALDTLTVSGALTKRLRDSLARELDTKSDSIMICASHNHTGPAGLQDWFPRGTGVKLNDNLIEQIEGRLINAAGKAQEQLGSAKVVSATGEIQGIGTDRNRPVAAPDSGVTVLKFDRQDGIPIAILFHYACHPTVLGPQLAYSADFPGAARRHLQAKYPGATCLFLNGAAGNISTRFTRRDQSFGEVERFGTLLADHVEGLLQVSEAEPGSLDLVSSAVELPIRKFSAMTVHEFQRTGNQRIDQTRAEGAALEKQLAVAFANRKAQSVSLVAVKIGNWTLCFVPGEPFNELAAELRQNTRKTLVIGYANEYVGYFPTRQAIADETYEALSSPYDGRALDMIRQAFEAMF